MIIDRLFASDSESISDTRNPRLWMTDWAHGGQTLSGVRVSPESAMALSAYYASLRNLSEDIGKVPLKVQRKRADGGKSDATDHPVYRLLHDAPNPSHTSITFREMMMHWAMGWGNAYAEIITGSDGNHVALWPIHPSAVTPIRAKNSSIDYIIRRQDKEPAILLSRQMLHIRGLGDDLVGYSVARLGSESLGRAMATQKYSSAFYGNGMRIGGVVQNAGRLKTEAYERLRDSIAERHQGVENAHKPLILEDGSTWTASSIAPEEAQMLETIKFTVTDVARWFRMPPHKIQDLERATFSNIEQQSIEYVTDTLMPWMVRIEQEIKRKLFANEPDMFAEHVVNALLRGDSAARGAFYTTQLRNGGMVVNDILRSENFNPIGPAGEQRFVTADMVPLEQIGQEEEPPPSPEPFGNVPPQPPDPPDPSERIKKAHCRVLADVAGRLMAKEIKAVQRAVTRCTADGEFAAWADKFYLAHTDYVRDALLPGLESLVESLGRDTSRCGPWVSRFASLECDGRLAVLRRSRDPVAVICKEAESWPSSVVFRLTEHAETFAKIGDIHGN